jgi:hypothetical protein
MRKDRGKHEGDLTITDSFALHGMTVGTVTVGAGGLLRLHGMVAGDLIVDRAGEARVHGMVSRNVINCGGRVELFGMVHGDVITMDGATFIDDEAAILGQVIRVRPAGSA